MTALWAGSGGLAEAGRGQALLAQQGFWTSVRDPFALLASIPSGHQYPGMLAELAKGGLDGR